MSFIGNIAARAGLRERRIDSRVPARGLEAYFSAGGEEKPAVIKDISSAGISLVMEDPMPVGADLVLTLRRKNDSECGTRVSMPARVVRAGRRDVGLEFVNPYVDAAQWSSLVLKAAQLSSRNDGVRVFRIAKVLAFLQRISPQAEKEFIKAMSGGMSYDGEERALEIILRAQALLSSNGQILRCGIDAKLIGRIIDSGMNLDTFDADMAHGWAGMLAASALEGTNDKESAEFVDLLSTLELVHLRILTAGCVMAIAAGWDAGYVIPRRIQCGVRAMEKIAGVRDPTAIDWALNRLQEIDLLQKTDEPPTLDPVTQVDITPTSLGLKFYARCTGKLELPNARPAGAESAA